MPDQVTFVTTIGHGSMDKYAMELGRRLPVPRLVTDVYEESADVWSLPLLSGASLRIARQDVRFVRELRDLDGVVHLPNHHLGRYGRFLSRPYAITVHDLIRYFDLARPAEPLIHPPNRRDRLLLRLDYAGIRHAAAVITASRSTRRDVIDHLGVPPEKVHAVHLGIDHELYRPVERRVRDGPYVVFVGTEHPRKNFARVLEAFAAVKRAGAERALTLVKVGAPGKGEWPFREATERRLRELRLGDDVVFTGRVSDEDVVALYAGARCLVLPSLYEGFGFPVLEAMACGCPVVTSTVSSIPELAGDAALLVDPCDVDAIAAALRRVADDDALRASLRERGLRRAARFTWDRTARATLAVYERVWPRAGRRAGEYRGGTPRRRESPWRDARPRPRGPAPRASRPRNGPRSSRPSSAS